MRVQLPWDSTLMNRDGTDLNAICPRVDRGAPDQQTAKTQGTFRLPLANSQWN